jgi:hypothetical protein
MNVSSGATVELVIKAIGEILPLPLLEHGSVVCPSSLISDSLKACEIFTIKQTSGQKANHMLTSAEEANLVSSLRFGVENGWLSSFYSCLIKKYDKAENIESKFAELERLPGDLNSQETSVSYSLKNNADLIACKAEYYHQCGEYQKCFELTTTLFERDPFHLKCQPLPHRMQWIRGIVNCLLKARLQ